jgi:hypothetical protein
MPKSQFNKKFRQKSRRSVNIHHVEGLLNEHLLRETMPTSDLPPHTFTLHHEIIKEERRKKTSGSGLLKDFRKWRKKQKF